MVWRLDTLGSRSRAAMAAASRWVKERADATSLYLRSSLGFSPIWWLGAKLWAGVCAFGRLVKWVLVPKGDAPLDVLKHYVSVLIVLIGAGALLWSAKQIAYPPLVITVAKLPEPLEKEYWLNPELSRTLIGEIERLRAVVKGERDPAFEAVLNPPNIIVKTGEWSLNVQEQILTPLGSLLGRGQGEVHLALNCYHPGCARTTDKECRDLAPLKASDNKVPESTTADGKTTPKQYLCLRLTADIQRGLSHYRLTPRLTVSPDDAEMTDAMARVAEAVTTVADPATATLYFYRRIHERKRDPNVSADVIADLVSEASKAAEQAEKNDAVSACWAHTIRAHLAVDRREFNLAEIYLARAKNISFLSHLFRLTSPSDCRRLIMIAEMEFARQLAAPPENETYPPHKENNDNTRVLAALNRVKSLLDEQQPAGWARVFGNSAENEDLTDALKLVQAEIGLSRVRRPDQCQLLKAGRNRQPVPEENSGAAESSPERATVRLAIRNAVEKLDSLKPEEQLPPLTRQASLDLMSHFARNVECAEEVVEILQKLDLNHPTDERVMQLLLAITETIALRKTASLLGRPAEDSDKGNKMLEAARKIYQRIAATGSDRTVALTRLAVIAEAKSAEDDKENRVPSEETLQNLKRAWQRHEHDINATRERGELIVSFWGMVLMRSYPEDMLTADFSHIDPEVTVNPEYRNAIANKTEFERALHTLYDTAHPARLADLPHLKDIGSRIGCLCMLSYVTSKNELADFFISRLDRWQKQNIDQPACRRDLIPQTQTRVPNNVKQWASFAERKFTEAENALQKAGSKTPKLQGEFEKWKKVHEEAQENLRKANITAEHNSTRYREKVEAVEKAAKACYVDAPASAAPTASPSSP
jgi:hypothetical protein